MAVSTSLRTIIKQRLRSPTAPVPPPTSSSERTASTPSFSRMSSIRHRLVSSGEIAYRGVIPAASVDWPAGAMRTWLGGEKRFMVFPMRAHQLLNFVGFVPTHAEMQESWSAPG